MASHYNITLWFQKTFHIQDNLYISAFLTYNITKEQLKFLELCLQEYTQNDNLSKALKKLKHIHLFDITNYFGAYAFDKGILCFNHLCFYIMWIISDIGNTHNIAEQILKKYKVPHLLLRQLQHNDNSYMLNIYLTFRLNNDLIHHISKDIQNSMLLSNRKAEFNSMLRFVFKYHKIIFYDEDVYEEELQ